MKILRYAINNKGVTLIELMIVMVLSLVLSAATYMAFQVLYTSNLSHEQVTYLQQDLRAAMDIISRDILNSGCSGSGNGVIAITNTTGLNSLGMYAPSWIGYKLDGTNLTRSSGTTPEVLITNVTSFGLSYFDGNTNNIGVPSTTNVSNLRYINVFLQVRSGRADPDTGQFIERFLQRSVGLRNPQ